MTDSRQIAMHTADAIKTSCNVPQGLGVALGFVLPPILVPNNENVQHHMELMFLGTALITSFLLILIFMVYQDKPPVPPSHAKLGAQISMCKRTYAESITSLFMNVGFVLLVITYGVNVGSFYAISTLLNQIVLSEFPREEMMVGVIGLTIVISGMFGSVVTGLWLDRSRMYRGTTVVVYLLSLIGMIIFTFTLRLHNIWLVFGVSAFLGFFMTGYLPLGFEFAAELTFPEPEGTSSGLLNASAQTFGIIFTMAMGSLLQEVSVKVANLFLCGSLLIGAVLTALIKSDLRRQQAEKQVFEMVPEAEKLPVEADGSEEIKQMKETTT
ncbi:choline/ethanolamine transporter flvcr2b-like isoform X2 [Amphiura filiformis]|uniref:choline/ethanolamine transporter flvcr2b-like isoform X2 n=1 Tax=Amphiura filiformis TaxID=82378 RepID=UPI003B228326